MGVPVSHTRFDAAFVKLLIIIMGHFRFQVRHSNHYSTFWQLFKCTFYESLHLVQQNVMYLFFIFFHQFVVALNAILAFVIA